MLNVLEKYLKTLLEQNQDMENCPAYVRLIEEYFEIEESLK